MSEIRIYAKLAASYVRSSMQHRASFVMSVVRNGISSFGDLARLMLLGFSFGALGGWSQAEIAVPLPSQSSWPFPSMSKREFLMV